MNYSRRIKRAFVALTLLSAASSASAQDSTVAPITPEPIAPLPDTALPDTTVPTTATPIEPAASSATSVTLAPTPLPPGEAPEKAKNECPWGESRRLGSHAFLTPLFVPSALVESYFGFRTSGEVVSTPNVPFSADRRFDLQQAKLSQSFDLGVRIIDRFGLFATFFGGANSSLTSRSLVIRGGNYELGGRIGAILKLFELGKSHTQLSLRGHVGLEGGQVFTVLPLLTALDAAPVRNAVDIVTGDLRNILLMPFSGFVWGGELALAQPLGAVFSLQASAGLSFESLTVKPFNLMENRRVDRDLSTVRPEFGLALTADLKSIHVPIAFMLEYALALIDLTDDQSTLSTSTTQHVAALGVYYSGRSDLQVGVEGFIRSNSDPLDQTASDGTTRSSDSSTTGGGVLALRYYW